MNTKTAGISSGLVVSIYLAFSDDGENIRFWTSNAFRAVEWAQENWETEAFVRLSDAEAVISKLSSKDRYGVCDECGTPYAFDPTDGGTICIKCQKDKIAQKDAEILEQCRINGMGAEREATLLGKVERQSAALKLAREALFDMQDSYAAVHGWKDSFVIAATTAIAAIDSLQKGE